VLQAGPEFIGQGVQPRYLWPLFAVTIGMALVPEHPEAELKTGRGHWHPNGRQLTALAIAAAFSNALALLRNLGRYVAGLQQDGDYYALHLHAGDWWWSWLKVGPNLIWVLGVVGGLGFFLALSRLAIEARAPVVPAVEGHGAAIPAG